MRASFDLGQVEAALAGTPFAHHLHHVASTGSTNALALEAAQAGVATGVWLADEQTAGRGRGGHTWHSSVGDGLYVSVLLRPRLFGADALKLSLAAGLAAKHAIAEAGGIPAERIDLRWPNDLMITGRDGEQRKFGGILTESSMDGGDGALAYAVIGVGMNLNHAAMPAELSDLATSLYLAGGELVSREAILIEMLCELAVQVNLVEAEAGGIPKVQVSLSLRFERASTWVRGLSVHVAEGDGYTGVTDGLDPHGLLRVRLANGSTRTVRHGSVRRSGQGQGG